MVKTWQELQEKITAVLKRIPVVSPSKQQIREDKREIEIFRNTITITRRAFIIRGYQIFLQLYLFLDNGSY
jgi:hypothetical protein